jgi:hypothetical protein
VTQQVLNVAEGQPLQQSLGFVANSVTINNITQSWAYERMTQTFIPPYQYGVIIVLPGSDVAEIQWQTPTSLPVGPVGTGTLAATYTTTTLVPSNGMSVFTQQTTLVLGKANPPGTTDFTLPAGCQALLIVTTAPGTVSVEVAGVATGDIYFFGTGGQEGGIIVPISALNDPIVAITNGGPNPLTVIALFTSQPEPITEVAVTGSGGGPVSVNVAQVDGTAIPTSQLPVTLNQIGGTPVSNVVPGTLDVNIKDVGGSPTGVLNVNIADLNGSASVVGQELMAASFPVVIASDQSAVAENLTQISGTAVRTTEASAAGAFVPGVLPVQGTTLVATGAAGYLTVLQRPIFDVFAGTFVLVATVGQTVIAAPGVGFSIIVNRIHVSYAAAPAAAAGLQFGTVSGGVSVGELGISITAATADKELVYDGGFNIGTNLPLIITATVADAPYIDVMYSIVTSANWPTG